MTLLANPPRQTRLATGLALTTFLAAQTPIPAPNQTATEHPAHTGEKP